MKSTMVALLVTSITLPAFADDVYYDTARVISVVPQSERVNNPRQECRTEYVRESYNNERSLTGPVIGGIAGGLLGSRIGRGSGRVAGAVVGAGVGALIGDQLGNHQRDYQNYTDRPVQRCVNVDNWQIVNRGYLVTYRYNGRQYSTIMDTQPGDSIRVNVAVDDNQSIYPRQRVEQIRYVEQGYRQPAPIQLIPGWNVRSNAGYREDRHENHGWHGHHRQDDARYVEREYRQF
ncbi:MAG: glycine zipper 2TM domain-containing protein [Methylophilaceae bacterium]